MTGDRLPLDVGDRGADLEGRYRYRLWRDLSPDPIAPLLWIMLNPSTADADADDPTLRRVISFSRSFGADRVDVVNLYALRTPHPEELLLDRDPTGPRNVLALERALSEADAVVAAWGSWSPRTPSDRQRHEDRIEETESLVDRSRRPIYCLGLTAWGRPRRASPTPVASPDPSRPRSCGGSSSSSASNLTTSSRTSSPDPGA